ncbi:hypothetical protein ES703_88844 [subsurface metagenome]
MDKKDIEEVKESTARIIQRIDQLKDYMDLRFEKLKNVIGEYLDLSSNISMATVKANLKSV